MDVHDPDAGWTPNKRPQSTLARNFSAALDDLFRLDGGLDDLSKNVHQRKQTVTIRNEELEALEARLRETEERLKMAKTSPPSRKDSQRRTPIQGTFPEDAKSHAGESGSPLAHHPRRTTKVDTESNKRNEKPDRPRGAQKDSEDESDA